MTRSASDLTPAQRRAVRARFKVYRNSGAAETGRWVYQPHDFDGSFDLWSAGYETRREAVEAAFAEMSDPTNARPPAEGAETTAKGGATKPRQFRFTDEEIARIDALAEHFRSDPAITVTRVDVLRIALRKLADETLTTWDRKAGRFVAAAKPKTR